MKRNIFLTIIFILLWMQTAFAGVQLQAVYPYSLDKQSVQTVYGSSTMPLYINITSFDDAFVQKARLKVVLPQGFTALPNAKWQLLQKDNHMEAVSEWELPAAFGQTFDLLYLQAGEQALQGQQEILVEAEGQQWHADQRLRFMYQPQAGAVAADTAMQKPDNKNFNWYIQDVLLPVDNLGQKDDRTAEGVIYVRDTTLEGFRNRMTGDGATNWSAVFNHPATFLLLDMRNPQQDIRVLRFKAELMDKKTGKLVPGLCTASKVNEDAEHGWAGSTGQVGETTAMISLDGKKVQTFIIPLYVDYFTVLEGDYSLRVTVAGNGQEKIQEVPLTIAKKHNLGLVTVAFSFICLLVILSCSYRLKNCIYIIGARGAITVALFAALAFGGITMPTTIIGDLLHVFLGPFSGLITGILSGILQYLLIMALLVLFRASGVLTLMFFVKYMLSCLMFGHFTPLGVLSTCVYVVVLETVLYVSGFYKQKEIQAGYMLGVAVLLGFSDALVTFINLEQMMFFYRLYYADWYVALYMLVNGLLYSSIGVWMGYKIGMKLQQVMGE